MCTIIFKMKVKVEHLSEVLFPLIDCELVGCRVSEGDPKSPDIGRCIGKKLPKAEIVYAKNIDLPVSGVLHLYTTS